MMLSFVSENVFSKLLFSFTFLVQLLSCVTPPPFLITFIAHAVDCFGYEMLFLILFGQIKTASDVDPFTALALR